MRDDGVSYGDYLEQLTYLIFLKMADEYGKPPYDRDVGIPETDGGGPISPNDSLVADDGERYDYVLANLPFGKKSALSITNEEGAQQTNDLPEPEDLAAEIIKNLEAGLDSFRIVLAGLESE